MYVDLGPALSTSMTQAMGLHPADSCLGSPPKLKTAGGWWGRGARKRPHPQGGLRIPLQDWEGGDMGRAVCKDNGENITKGAVEAAGAPRVIATGGDACSLTRLFPAFPAAAGSAVSWAGREARREMRPYFRPAPTRPSSWKLRAVNWESPSSRGPLGLAWGSQRTGSQIGKGSTCRGEQSFLPSFIHLFTRSFV